MSSTARRTDGTWADQSWEAECHRRMLRQARAQERRLALQRTRSGTDLELALELLCEQELMESLSMLPLNLS